MGNLFGRQEIQELREELARTEAALQKHREAAAHELDTEQRRRKAAEVDAAARAAATERLKADVEAAKGEALAAEEAALAARKAHDEHALLVKRVLTAQRKYGVGLAWPGVPSASDASTEAARLAASPSSSSSALLGRGALDASARVGELSGHSARLALAEAEDLALAALLWPRPLGDVSATVRTPSTLFKLGLELPGLPGLLDGALGGSGAMTAGGSGSAAAGAGGGGAGGGGGSGGGLSTSVVDSARLSAGLIHRLLPLGGSVARGGAAEPPDADSTGTTTPAAGAAGAAATVGGGMPLALGLCAIYDPVFKSIEHCQLSLLAGRAVAADYGASASTGGGSGGGVSSSSSRFSLAHARASIDHNGELALTSRWLVGGSWRVDTVGAVDVNRAKYALGDSGDGSGREGGGEGGGGGGREGYCPLDCLCVPHACSRPCMASRSPARACSQHQHADTEDRTMAMWHSRAPASRPSSLHCCLCDQVDQGGRPPHLHARLTRPWQLAAEV
jgi:hypothetical protein